MVHASETGLTGPPRSRSIGLTGAFNLRDLGGYACADGWRVRSRRLFRADGPERLTPDDRRVVDGLGIATVVDLRVPGEGGDADWAPAGATTRRFPLFDTLPDLTRLDAVATPADVGAQYLRRLEASATTMVAIVEVMAACADRPILFHCTAGKDRTGLVAASILALLGAPDETIVEDYALSHDGLRHRIDASVRAPLPTDVDYGSLPKAVVAAHPDAMRSLLGDVTRRHGSLARWLRVAGVSDRTVTALRQALLEHPERSSRGGT